MRLWGSMDMQTFPVLRPLQCLQFRALGGLSWPSIDYFEWVTVVRYSSGFIGYGSSLDRAQASTGSRRSLLQGIRALLQELHEYCVTHICREGNACADILA